MLQLSLGEEDFPHHQSKTLKTRKRVFLEQMEQVVPWSDWVALIAPHAPSKRPGKAGRPPFLVETMLRIHFLQQWFNLSDSAMEEALHDMALFRHFAGLDLTRDNMPIRRRFCGFAKKHDIGSQMLAAVNARLSERGLLFKAGTLVDATIIAAPGSTKNKTGERDPEMHSTKKGNQWHFGMKAHIGVDAESGLVHTVVGTAAHVHDVTQAAELLHGHRQTGKLANWQTGKLANRIETLKARVRAKVEHPFRVIKRQFGHVKVRYRGLAKNTAQLYTLFALSNFWMVRGQLLPAKG
ncbi:transposase [Ventosimonas gracilis]|uniref:Transposase n=1 Tax=Ventosimonas gracilis TaxID=1680762 RepID=A0A139SWF6_9GAMM|nr:IS5 family transposase [Ventosimonas gracilis]KXU38752.1 transposase [Ventosimonas gracilis]